MNRTPGHIARNSRVSVWHHATLVLTDGSEHAVTITDVSSGGFKLRTEATIPIGSHVFVRVDRFGDFPAQIRWALGNEAGGEFLQPVDLAAR